MLVHIYRFIHIDKGGLNLNSLSYVSWWIVHLMFTNYSFENVEYFGSETTHYKRGKAKRIQKFICFNNRLFVRLKYLFHKNKLYFVYKYWKNQHLQNKPPKPQASLTHTNTITNFRSQFIIGGLEDDTIKFIYCIGTSERHRLSRMTTNHSRSLITTKKQVLTYSKLAGRFWPMHSLKRTFLNTKR